MASCTAMFQILILKKHNLSFLYLNEWHFKKISWILISQTLWSWRKYPRIYRRYYWTGMWTVITNYVKNCTDCSRYKASNTKPTGHLQILIYYGQYEILDTGLRGNPLGGSEPNPLVREDTWSLTSGGSLGIHCFHEWFIYESGGHG